MKHRFLRRIAAILAAVCLLVTILPGSTDNDTAQAADTAVSADTEDSEDTSQTSDDDILSKVKICRDGEEISGADFYTYEKITLTAEYAGSGDAAYQWQIYSAEQSARLSISGKTETEIEVGYAMIKSLLDTDNTAFLHCRVTDGELLYYSDAIVLYVNEEETAGDSSAEEETTLSAYAAETDVAKMYAAETDAADTDAGTETEGTLSLFAAVTELSTCTITIKYLYYEGTTAYGSYTANVISGSDFSRTVSSPTIVGYSPYIDVTDTTTKSSNDYIYTYTDDGGDVHYVYGTDVPTVTLSYTSISADDTVTVWYYPSLVEYTVLHYVQSILNDDYVLYKMETLSGYVGDTVEVTDLTTSDSGDSEMNSGGYIYVSGSETSMIAADGSTMIYAYYDRVYFVMTFDLDGGSGVSSIYAKYGTTVSVSDPEKTGYTFAGWYDEEDDTKTIVSLPETIPAKKTRYVATWTAADTTYTVVYWRENANDDDYSYWCQETVTAVTDSTIDFDDIKEPSDISSDDEAEYFTYYDTDYDTSTTVAADGSTVINVYYSRNEYTFRFFFARYYSGTWYISTGTGSGWFFRVFNTTTANNNTIQTIQGVLGSAQSLTIDTSNRATYATMAGVTEANVSLGTYYYVTLTAKYNADISDQWPLGVGTTSDSDKTDQNMILDTQESGSNPSSYLFVSWGTQEGSAYWESYSNKNIKGPYQTMSAELIETVNADGSHHDFMAYYASSVYTYTYEIYLQNTDGTWSDSATTSYVVRSTADGSGQNQFEYEGFTFYDMVYGADAGGKCVRGHD